MGKDSLTKCNNFFGSFNVHITHFLETLCFSDKRVDALNRFTDLGHFGDSLQMRIEINLLNARK